MKGPGRGSEAIYTKQGSCLTIHKVLGSVPNTGESVGSKEERKRYGGRGRGEEEMKGRKDIPSFPHSKRAAVVALDFHRFLRQPFPSATLVPNIIGMWGC